MWKRATTWMVLIIILVLVRPFHSSAEENAETLSENEDTETAGEEMNELEMNAFEPSGELFPITATKKVAENELIELYIDEATGNIRLKHKKSGQEWLGAPQVDTNTLPNNKAFIDSPIHMEYTDGASVSETYTLKDAQNAVSIQTIEDGVRVEFAVEEIKVTFAIEYRLTNDGFEVMIPDGAIVEEGTVRVTSLEVLPFFHAASVTDDGAVFVPDGSGALMTIKEQYPQYFNGYSQPVYGPDHTFASELGEVLADGWRQAAPPKELIALPVFGLYRNDTGYLGIITKGEETAKINATPAGIRNIPLYSTGAEFVYRKQDVMFIGSSGRIPLFQLNKIEGERKINYILLEDEQANYVGMAHAYRDYLTNELGVTRSVQGEVPLSIQLLGGITRDEIIGSTFIGMTTFEQARSIIDDYTEKGLTQLNMTLKGWNKDGLYGNQPNHFPVERNLGGKKDLEALVEYAAAKGVSLYLETNYVRPFQDSNGFSQRSDVVRGIDREVMPSFNHYISSRFNNSNETFYLLKPNRAYHYMLAEIEQFKELGIAGLHLNHIGNLLYSDQDPNHPTSRAEAISVWKDAMNAVRERVGEASVDYGFAYSFGYIDRIINAPLDSSHFIYMDKAIPFYQIALRGLIPYTAKPSNLRDDERFELLRAIEYGALPSFELTYERRTNCKERWRTDSLVLITAIGLNNRWMNI